MSMRDAKITAVWQSSLARCYHHNDALLGSRSRRVLQERSSAAVLLINIFIWLCEFHSKF